MAKKDIILIAVIVVILAALSYVIYDQVFSDKGQIATVESNTLADHYEEEEDSYGEFEEEDAVSYADVEDVDEYAADDMEEAYEESEDYEEDDILEDYASVESGKYMVMAGQFQQMVWAEAQRDLMLKKGYDQTRIELFDRGSWAAVMVNRFDTYSAAESLMNELIDQGVEATIIPKQ
jgi:tRNA U55 pseudouridine synthase TruB